MCTLVPMERTGQPSIIGGWMSSSGSEPASPRNSAFSDTRRVFGSMTSKTWGSREERFRKPKRARYIPGSTRSFASRRRTRSSLLNSFESATSRPTRCPGSHTAARDVVAHPRVRLSRRVKLRQESRRLDLETDPLYRLTLLGGRNRPDRILWMSSANSLTMVNAKVRR